MKDSHGDRLALFVRDMVYAKKQVRGSGVDLTAASIRRLAGKGSVDFGGGEWTAAEARELEPQKRAPEDEYGWWELEPGQYLLRYNEKLAFPPPCTALIVPAQRLLLAGGWHAAVATDGQEPVAVLCVGQGGLRMKQNARVSTLVAANPQE